MRSRFTILFCRSFAKFLVGGSLGFFSLSSLLAGHEDPNCLQQLKHALSTESDHNVIDKKCRLSTAIMQWISLQKTANLPQAMAFLAKHKDWPGRGKIRQVHEQYLYESNLINTAASQWFTQYPPLTGAGALQAMRLQRRGILKAVNANTLLEKCSFDVDQLSLFLQENKHLVTNSAAFRKAQSLFLKKAYRAVKELLPYTSERHQRILELCLEEVEKPGVVSRQFATFSPQLRNVPLILYAHVTYLTAERKNNTAAAILKQLPAHASPEMFWPMRNLIVRRFLEEKAYQKAYDLVKNHGLRSGEDFANAEWLAGWLSLRFIRKPQQAVYHFKALVGKVRSPVSVARAQYWLGRAFQAMGSTKEARQAFAIAKKHPGTYYGQQAFLETTGKLPRISFASTPQISPKVRAQFNRQELVRVIRLLHSVDARTMAQQFLMAFMTPARTMGMAERYLLIELAHQNSPYAAVHFAKSITRFEVLMYPFVFPRVSTPTSKIASRSFIHAIIRQESRFKADAISHAGAIGLMQLMPQTAQMTAKKHRLRQGSLTHAPTNMRIGVKHIEDLMRKYKNSPILTAAAYNAGAKAVDSWIQQFGDPRAPGVNVVDWVETIPYGETRNYVQRVIENERCYRGKK